MINKRIILLVAGLFSLVAAIDPVYQIKAFDGSFRRAPLQKDQWQNLSSKVYFEWKEPWGEVNHYLYYFGKNKNGLPAIKTTEKNVLTSELDNEGVYYFNILAVDEKGAKSEVRSFAVKYDSVKPENLLAVQAFDDTKTNQLASGVAQSTVTKPFFKFNTANLKLTGAPLKGINVYWGPDKNGFPNRHLKNFDISFFEPIPKDTPYYLNASIEDEAGNVSLVKNLYTFIYNGEIPVIKDKPEIVISNRDISVDNIEGREGVLPGSVVKYTIKVKNKGAGTAFNVEIKDAIPANTTCVFDSGKSTLPALVEYWDANLNGGQGAWTTTPERNTSTITQVRWVYNDNFKPDTETEISYAVRINQ